MWFFHYNALVNGLASSLFGITALIKNPTDRKNRTYAFYCFSLSLWSYSYVLWQVSPNPSQATFFVRGLMMGAILIPITHLHHILELFDLKSPRVLKVGYALTGVLVISNFTPLFVAGVEPRLFFPYWPVPGILFPPYLAGFFGLLSYSLYVIYQARKQATGYQRNLLSWVMLATVVGYGGGATNFPLWYRIPLVPFGNCLVTLYTTTVFYILSRYRLMDIMVVFRKTLVYSVVTGTLMIIYLGVITVFSHLFEGLTGYQTVFSSGVAATLITFCFQPLQKRIQAFVDMKFFRQYVDREEKLYELSREVITHTTSEAMSAALMRVLGETLHPKAGVLYLRTRDGTAFTPMSPFGPSHTLERLAEDSPLGRYFADHPQPFVQELGAESGQPQSTRRAPHPERREGAA